MWAPFNMGAYGRKNASRRMRPVPNVGTVLRSPLMNFAEKNTRGPECHLVSQFFFKALRKFLCVWRAQTLTWELMGKRSVSH